MVFLLGREPFRPKSIKKNKKRRGVGEWLLNQLINTCSEKTTLSKAGTICPRPNDPKAPPFLALGQDENSRACAANAASSFAWLPFELSSFFLISAH